jgi:acetyl-CoA carboxylase carboxyltransferase component
MPKLISTLTKDDTYTKNKQTFTALFSQIKAIKEKNEQRSTSQLEKLEKAGKQTVQERIKRLTNQAEILLLSELAGHQLYGCDLPNGGIITAISTIEDQPVMIIANDPLVKGGTYFPITVKKHLRALSIAKSLNLPCIYLVDSGGAYLPLQAQLFPDKQDFGRIFYKQSMLSSQGIPQIAAVLGMCTAGGAYVPALSDQVIMVAGNSQLFLAGPPLVKAATGEKVSAQALGGAALHTETSGVADYMATDENHALVLCQSCIKHLPKQIPNPPNQPAVPPAYPAEQIYGLIPHDPRQVMDMLAIIARLVDDSNFEAFKPDYGTTLITGFAHLSGYLIGIVANQGVLLPESACKGAQFVQLCAQRNIPLIFLQNITGFMVGKNVEEQGITKHGAKMVMAVANANVPKFTIMTGASYGAGNYAMCGRAFNPSLLFSWPNAKTAVMGGPQASIVLSSISQHKNIDLNAQYTRESQAIYGSARLWDDGIIDPIDTRAILTQALKWAPTQSSTKFGVFRI